MKVIIYKDLVKVLTDLHLFNPSVVNISPDEYTSCFGVPIIEAEPVKHGKWIDSFLDAPFSSVQRICVCSNCKDIILRCNKERYLYCPHCGSIMDLD